MIYLKDIHKHYGRESNRVQALDSVSCRIEAGRFAAVMGPSGSGKSSLLSVMGALNTPDRGRYEVDGIDVYSLSQDRRADFRREYLGFVFQNFLLVPYLSLLENVMLPLAARSMKNSRKRGLALAALDRVGLTAKAGHLPGQASGGEQERAAVARAIVNQPPIILADEPTGNLDEASGRVVMDLLAGLNRDGCTVVMVTHSEQWAGYASRVLHMADGRLHSEPDPARAAA